MVKNYTNPTECLVYRGHASVVTCEKFAPNGFWVAFWLLVHIWSWNNPENFTKLEHPAFSAPVYDLDQYHEYKKVTVCDDGTGIIVKCFIWDTGNLSGEMVGQVKKGLSISYKPSRPFRITAHHEWWQRYADCLLPRSTI